MVNSLKILVTLVSIICLFTGCVGVNNTNISSSNATGIEDETSFLIPTKALTTQTFENTATECVNITTDEKTIFEIIEEQNINEVSINDPNEFNVRLFKELFNEVKGKWYSDAFIENIDSKGYIGGGTIIYNFQKNEQKEVYSWSRVNGWDGTGGDFNKIKRINPNQYEIFSDDKGYNIFLDINNSKIEEQELLVNQIRIHM